VKPPTSCYDGVVMGAIEDVRKPMQGFLAPQLGEIKERVEALERNANQQFKDLRLHMDSRFNSVEQMISLSERVARLEEQQQHKRQ